MTQKPHGNLRLTSNTFPHQQTTHHHHHPSMATATTNPDYTTLLATLAKVQQHDFTILRLSEEISAAGSRGDHTYNSDVSSALTSSPSALQADLGHYKVPLTLALTLTSCAVELTYTHRNCSRSSASAISSK